MKQTVKEKLMSEFECAITAVFGSLADQPSDEVAIDKEDLTAIAKKVAFYLGLD